MGSQDITGLNQPPVLYRYICMPYCSYLMNLTQVYCDMELSCGGRDGGWMRIGNIKDGDTCPNAWKQLSSPVQACRGNSDNAGCYSAYFNNNKFSYQHICGRVVGYQKGTPDGYYASEYTTYQSKAIDGPCVDGISLTYGTPRKHLFTYASGVSSGRVSKRGNCPCAYYPGTNPPGFVRDHHYCESGSINSPPSATVFYSDPCGMEKDASVATVAVHRLVWHGSTETS